MNRNLHFLLPQWHPLGAERFFDVALGGEKILIVGLALRGLLARRHDCGTFSAVETYLALVVLVNLPVSLFLQKEAQQ